MSQTGAETQARTPDRTNEDSAAATTPQSGNARSAAEWTTFGISLAILVGIFGVITYLHFQGEEQPPRIVAESDLENVRYDGNMYYLPVEVTNTGDRTVEDVVVQAELETGSGAPATAEFTVTFLAGGEHARGTFIFEDDPRQGTLTVQAVSFKEP